METRGNYILVGVLSIVIIIAAFGFAFWIAGPLAASARTSYNIVFPGPVDGLANGAVVTYKGLKVGEVKDITISGDTPGDGDIVARISINASTPIKADTKAQLEFHGLNSFMGAASIGLSGGDPNLPLLVNEDGKPPVLHATTPLYTNLIDSAERMTPQLSSLAERANRLTDENAEYISVILKNSAKLTSVLATNSDNIQQLMTAMTDLSKSVKPLTVKLDVMTDRIDNILSAVSPDKVKETTSSLANVLKAVDKSMNTGNSNALLTQVTDTMHSVRRLTDDLDTSLGSLKEITANLSRFTGPGLQQVQALTVDARGTLEQLKHVLVGFGKDPNQIIFGKKAALPDYFGP